MHAQGPAVSGIDARSRVTGIVRALRPRIMHVVAALACLGMATTELNAFGFDRMNWPARIVSGAYLLALVALPVLPVPASVTIVIVTFAELIGPSHLFAYGYVQSIWGFWYALVVITLERSVWIAASMLGMAGAISLAQGERLFRWGIMHMTVMTMMPFLLIAMALGATMRVWRSAMRERSQAEASRRLLEQENRQQQERLAMLHQLHDSVAGSLAYAVMLCRQAERDASGDAARLRQVRRIEEAVDQALTGMRREVIEPTRRLLDGRSDDPSVSGVDVPEALAPGRTTRYTVEQALERTEARLRSLGYDCDTLLRGDCGHLSELRLAFVGRAVTEIGNNIVRHGRPGYCAITVRVTDDGGMRIWSSNPVDGAGVSRGAAVTGGEGLALIRRDVEASGGMMTCGLDDGAWTVSIAMPAEACGHGTGARS